jgi:hypothetical protein
LLGPAEPTFITGTRREDYREGFVGIDVKEQRNAITIADACREERFVLRGIDASDTSMRRGIQRIATKLDRVYFCYESSPASAGPIG